MIGKTVYHYKIIEQISSGGTGVVYKAQDLKLDLFVALKFLPPYLTNSDEEKKCFIQEASVLDHNTICAIYEIDETKPALGELGEGQMFICMAKYEGENLNRRSNNNHKRKNSLWRVKVSLSKKVVLSGIIGILQTPSSCTNTL